MTLPTEIRAALAIKESDLLEANIENGRVLLRPKVVVDRDRQAAVERFLACSGESAARVEAQLKAEGKTWEDLDAEIAEEVRAVRKSGLSAKRLNKCPAWSPRGDGDVIVIGDSRDSKACQRALPVVSFSYHAYATQSYACRN